MASILDGKTGKKPSLGASDLLIPGVFALLAVALQGVALGNYGYFRDELYYIACSNHLAWGYVDQPPLSIVVLGVARSLLGDSLWAVRLPALIALGAAMVLSGLLTRSLGGGRFAQAVTGIALLANPTILGETSFFSMNSLDLLFWSALALTLSETLQSGSGRGWLLFGVLAGLGLLNKYSVGFFGTAVVVALIFSRYRGQLLRPQLWLGGVVAFLLFLPHVIWQVRMGFPSLEFMYNASHFKNAHLPPHIYVLLQVVEMGPVNALLWGGGLVWALWPRHAAGGAPEADARPKLFALIFLLLLAFYAFSTGAKTYYMATAYSFMIPVGARALESVSRARPILLRTPAAALLCLGALITLPLGVPILAPETLLRYQARLGLAPTPGETSHRGLLPQHFGDRFGWPEMVAEITRAYTALKPEDQRNCVVVAMNYGEAGALEFFGDANALPPVVCGHNSYYLWRTVDLQPATALVPMKDPSKLLDIFEEVTQVGFIDHPYAMEYESELPLYLCRGRKVPMDGVWKMLRMFI